MPSAPENVEVEALTEKSLIVSWSSPESNSDSVTEYSINATSLKTFDDHILEPIVANNKTSTSHMINVKVPGSQFSTVLNNLVPFTMYEVTVTARNRHGSSLPSYKVRELTNFVNMIITHKSVLIHSLHSKLTDEKKN